MGEPQSRARNSRGAHRERCSSGLTIARMSCCRRVSTSLATCAMQSAPGGVWSRHARLIQRIHALSAAPDTPASTPAPLTVAEAPAREPVAPAAPAVLRPSPVASVEVPTFAPVRPPELPRVERPIPAPTPESPHFAMGPQSTASAESLAARPEALDGVDEEEDIVAPIALPPGREPQPAAERQELARVDAELLDHAPQQCGRGEHLPLARSSSRSARSSSTWRSSARTVTRLRGAAAQARARDRGADPAPAPGGASAARATSIRSSSTAIRRSSSSRARSPNRPATSRACEGCSRT